MSNLCVILLIIFVGEDAGLWLHVPLSGLLVWVSVVNDYALSLSQRFSTHVHTFLPCSKGVLETKLLLLVKIIGKRHPCPSAEK